MNVLACDDCKKLNTQVALLAIAEARRGTVRGEFPKPSDPIIGFRVFRSDRIDVNLIEEYSGHTMLCHACAQKKIAELLPALLP